MKEIEFTYWKNDDFYIGFINQYPDYETQGISLDDLKANLIDLWKDLESDEVPYIRKKDKLLVA